MIKTSRILLGSDQADMGSYHGVDPSPSGPGAAPSVQTCEAGHRYLSDHAIKSASVDPCITFSDVPFSYVSGQFRDKTSQGYMTVVLCPDEDADEPNTYSYEVTSVTPSFMDDDRDAASDVIEQVHGEMVRRNGGNPVHFVSTSSTTKPYGATSIG